MCVKYALFGSRRLPRSVYIDLIHLIKRTRPSPFIFTLNVKNWTVGRLENGAMEHLTLYLLTVRNMCLCICSVTTELRLSDLEIDSVSTMLFAVLEDK